MYSQHVQNVDEKSQDIWRKKKYFSLLDWTYQKCLTCICLDISTKKKCYCVMFTQVISLTKADMCEEIGIQKMCVFSSWNELKIHTTIIIFNHWKQPANQPTLLISSLSSSAHLTHAHTYIYTQTAIMFWLLCVCPKAFEMMNVL